MTITTWSADFSKKRNSTKVPASGSGRTVNAVLKNPCSIMNPVFELNAQYDNAKYLQCSIGGRTRFYFVTDIVYITNDIIEIHCRQDALATWKYDVENSTQYVERSASSNNPDITDPMNTPTLDFLSKTVHLQFENITFSTAIATGCYILITSGMNLSLGAGAGTGAGMSNAWVLDNADMFQLANKFFDVNIIQGLKNEYTNPLQAIIKCIWLPFAKSSLPGQNFNLYLGSQDMQMQCKFLGSRYITDQISLDPSQLYPNYSPAVGYDYTEENYFQCEPYSEATMYLPYVGSVEMPLEMFYKTTRTLQISIDLLTGDVVYTLGSESPLATYSGNCGANCPIAAETADYKNMLLGLIQFIGMSAGNAMYVEAGSALGMAGLQIAGETSFVGNTASRGAVALAASFETGSQINGALSSGMTTFICKDVVIKTFVRTPAMAINEMNVLYGRPLYKVVNLNTLLGYCKCNGAVLETVAEYESRLELEYFLDTGFYIE